MGTINERLKEPTDSTKSFGGISVIAIRDLFQIKPVCDASIFEKSKIVYTA
jgi:hypothetical protein